MPGARRRGGYRRLFRYAAPYKREWAAIVAATLLSTALSLLQPWPLKILVDHVLGHVPLRGALGAVLERLPFAATPTGLLTSVALAGILIFAVNSDGRFVRTRRTR
jgi:ABC-type multidrug transport system fused ATPase/permease subunit